MKLERTGCFGVLAALVILAVISSLFNSNFPDQKQSSDTDVKSLIAQEEKLSAQCTANLHDVTNIPQACDDAAKLFSQIEAKGWCWGHSDQVEPDRKWEPCQSAPQQTATETPPQLADNDTVQYDPDAAIHKAQYDQLNAGMNACMYRGIHGLLMQGIRNRSQLLDFVKNICGSGLKKFLISVGTPEAAADAWIDTMANDNLNAALREG